MPDTFIEFNGKKSSEFGLKLINDLEHTSTSYDIEQVEVKGRDGVLLIDNNRLKPVEREYPFKLVTGDKRVSDVATDISAWLNVKGWKTFKLSWDEEHVYEACYIEIFSIHEVLKNFGEVKLNFLLKPVKKLKSGLSSITLRATQTIKNQGSYIAKPVLTIRGNGNGEISINNRTLTFENVQGGIVVDSDKNLVHELSGRLSAWNKIVRKPTHSLPFFDVGNNVVTVSGNFEISMIPNWSVKL